MFELIWYHQQTLPSVTVKSLRFSKNLYVCPHGPWPTHLCQYVKTKIMYVCLWTWKRESMYLPKKISILNANMKCIFEYSCICKYEYFNICTLYACIGFFAKGSCEKKHYHQRLLKWWLPWKTLIKDCWSGGCLQRLSWKTVIKDCPSKQRRLLKESRDQRLPKWWLSSKTDPRKDWWKIGGKRFCKSKTAEVVAVLQD